MIPSLSSIEAELGVSRETSEALVLYTELLVKWTKSINLVSRNSLEGLWDRHILDSVQVYSCLEPNPKTHWVDLGSGGGLPGAVIAILAREFSPNSRVTCVESDQRKATFLRTVSRETGVKFDVIDARIEKIDPLKADVLSARALAPLTNLLGFADFHMKEEGCAIFPKGIRYASEVEEAKSNWHFNYESIPSATDSNAVLLKIRDITCV